MTTEPHPEIVAAWQKHTGNEHAKWPCCNFTAGFNAGLAAALKRELDADAAHEAKIAALATLQPLMILKLTDAQAEVLKKAMGIESGFDDPEVQVPDHGLPEKLMPPKMLHALIADLRATCAALRKQTGERGEIITRLRKERDGSREALKDVSAQRDQFRTELADRKAQLTKEVAEKAAALHNAEYQQAVRHGTEKQLTDATTALATAVQQAAKEAEAKHAALAKLAIAEAELAGYRKGWPTPKPKPWTLSELWQLIQNRQSGIVSEEQFNRVLNSRPVA